MKFKHNVKPLSANKMYWRGKRRKTTEYLHYQNEIRDELMGVEWPFGTDKVKFNICVGFSNRGADLDNAIKPFMDTYQSVFEDFNDNKVYILHMDKDLSLIHI